MTKKVQKKPRQVTKKPRKPRKRHPSKVPDWIQDIRINEKKRTIAFKMDAEGLFRAVNCRDKILALDIRPKTVAIDGRAYLHEKLKKESPGPYDYMLELRVGNLIISAPLNVFFPDEPTHGREFFEKIKGMLRDAGA